MRLLAEAPHLSVLLGAGASVAAGLPSWDDLALRLLRRAGAIEDATTARAYLATHDPLVVAEAARAVSGGDWINVVRAAMYDESVELFPRALHLAVAYLAATRPADVTLLTLNLDDLLEEALRDAVSELGRGERVVSRTAASPRGKSGEHEVQHLHGLLPRAMQEPAAGVIVLTLSDYNQLGVTPNPWQASALADAISRGPLLLAGTSYRDADIRQWLHSIQDQLESKGGSVFALVAREVLGLTRRQFSDVADPVRQQWSAVGIEAVLVQDHSDAAQVLREIPECMREGYRLPRDRAEALFARHVDDFTSLQAHHSETLDADRERLPIGSGEETDLTLWLADGSSDLVRWASHDRVYRSAEKLRRVPLGFDSAWVAARATSQSEVVVVATDQAQQGIRRWRTVIAAPITTAIAGGPNLTVGALSAATTATVTGDEETTWREAMADLVETWADRLASRG
jgi:hypothetical protein